jgi:hypothetical protein
VRRSKVRAKAGRRVKHVVRIRRNARYFAVIYQDSAGNWGHVARRAKRPKGKPLRLRVRPRRARVGRRRCFRARVTSRGKPVRRARVRLAGRVRRTGRSGRARLCVRLRHPGRFRATAKRRGYRTARATVRATRRRR